LYQFPQELREMTKMNQKCILTLRVFAFEERL